MPFSWDVQFLKSSIFLPQIDLWCDAHHPTPFSFVSHAHFDHLANHKSIIASKGTAKLMQARLAGERSSVILPLAESLERPPEPHLLAHATEVRLYPAGHIFGSAMLHLTCENQRFLYTGDFKLRPGRSAETCLPPRADVLIMETTFGLPKYVFPPTATVLRDIISFCQESVDDSEVPVLFGYSLGKSQELLCSLAEAGLPIMLHPQTEKMTRVYQDLGVTFPPFRPFLLAEAPGHVVICPPQANQSAWLRKIKRRRTASVTGWAMDPGAIYRYQCDAAFPLSDHADFNDLLRFVDLVQPKVVWTVHGWTREFAQTLRSRGIEAWPLGEESQLELPIFSAPTSASTAIIAPTLPIQNDPANTAGALLTNDLLSLANTAETVRLTASKLAKIEALATYLRALPDDFSLSAAVLALTGRPFPISSGRTLNCGWAIIKRALLSLTNLSESDFRSVYQQFSDSGDTAAAILRNHTAPEPFLLDRLTPFFTELADLRGPIEKTELLKKRLALLDPLAAKYLIKIITGDLRIGLKEGLVEEAIAAAFAQPLDLVKQGNMLTGDLAATAVSAKQGQLEALELRPFNPIHFMLASPEPSAQDLLQRFTGASEIWIEEKYDGIRCQVHKFDERVELYSRELRRITPQFPDLADKIRKLPADIIADGELLAWQNGRALPFAELQKRLGRKGDDFFLGSEIPVSICLYDLLALGPRSLLKIPLQERRHLLESISLQPTLGGLECAGVERISTADSNTVAAVEAAFIRARKRGNEGLMAKDPASLYTPGRRGLSWFKLKKAYATLDVVVVGVEWGHGKRKAVLSDYTFAIRDDSSRALEPAEQPLLTIGKAYSGLTDAEIAQYTEYFLEHTIAERGRFRQVIPNVVLEVAFDTIQLSQRHNSGYALRFPRIVRIRTDKTPLEIDALSYCRQLALAVSAPVES